MQGSLAKRRVQVKETVDAKAKLGKTDALKLAKTSSKVIVAKGKGKRITTFSMKKDAPDDATLLAHLLGPTGTLRAPTIVRGKTLLVGFNEEVYAESMG